MPLTTAVHVGADEESILDKESESNKHDSLMEAIVMAESLKTAARGWLACACVVVRARVF